jgi:hypothetical protein
VRDPSLDAFLALRPTTVLEALRARAVGRKTTARLPARWLLTDSERGRCGRRSTEEVGIE